MQFKIPKDTKEFVWTNHVVEKMRQHGISEQKVRSVIFRHTRKEEGIAPRTVAVMQPAGSKKHPTELWVMYQTTKKQKKNDGAAAGIRGDWKAILPVMPKKRIISAWRYPGVSPKRNPIPAEIMDALEDSDL